MYYIVETNYLGPHTEDPSNYAFVEITRQSLLSDGWLGQTADWDSYAHGRYATLEEARTVVRELWPHSVLCSNTHNAEKYRKTVLYRINRPYTNDRIYFKMLADIDKYTSNVALAELAERYEEEARANRLQYTGTLNIMKEFRDNLQ